MVDFDEQEREREREVCRLLFMEFGRGLAIPSLESGSTHYIIIVHCVFGVWPVAMEHSKENNICKNVSMTRRFSNIKQVHMVRKLFKALQCSCAAPSVQQKTLIIKHPFHCIKGSLGDYKILGILKS